MEGVKPQAGRPLPPLVPLRVSVRSIQEMAGLVRYAWRRGGLDDDDCVRALYSLSACDAMGVVWTTGIRSGCWYRRTGESWMRGEPEGPLLVALTKDAYAQLAKEMTAPAKGGLMRSMSPLARPPAETCRPGRPANGNANVTQSAGEPRPAFCIRCGAQLTPAGRFCLACGARRK